MLAELELHQAVKTRNFIAVSHLLKNGSDPNFALQKNLYPESSIKNLCSKVDLWTPLHFAVDVQDVEIVKLLICHQADINLEDEYGRTCLNLAASRGNVEIAKILLDAGAHVDSKTNKMKDEKMKWRIREPLHSAVESNNLIIAKMVIEKEADVNLEDGWNRTPLNLAISEGNSQMVELLLENGADVDKSVDLMEKKLRKSALHHVAEKLQIKIMKLLSTKFETKFNETQRILNLCFYRNYSDVNFLNEDEKFQTVVEVVKEHERILRSLVLYEININQTDIEGFSALHSACKEGNWQIAKTLLENGADPDQQEKSGKTPLHLALMHKRRPVVEILLDYEANFLISDEDGLTPMNFQGRYCPELDLESHIVRIEILKITENEYLLQDVLSYYERMCFDEIFDLKNEFFKFGTTVLPLYQIFVREFFGKLLRLCKNVDFCNEVYSERFYKRFPIYGDILRGRLDRARSKSILIEKGTGQLSKILKFAFPVCILEEILSYLSNNDIVNLMKLVD